MKVNIVNEEKSYPINYGDIFVRSQDHETKVYMLCELPINTSKESCKKNTILLSLLDGKSTYYTSAMSYDIVISLLKVDILAKYITHYPFKEYELSLSKLSDS